MPELSLNFKRVHARLLLKIALIGALLMTAVSGAVADNVHVNDENNLIVDGQPLFPIYLYHVPKPAIEEVESAGFNTVETPAYAGGVSRYPTAFTHNKTYVRSFVESLENRGMYYLYGPKESPELFRSIRDSPAHLMNDIEDEPAGGGMDPAVFARRAKKLRRSDPDHPIYLVDWAAWRSKEHSRRQLLAKMVPHADVLAVDIYPIQASGIHMDRVGLAIDHMREMSGGEKPIWYVGQLHQMQGDKGERQPTFREVRCMTYLALAHGVKGVGYYHYVNVSETPLWEKLPRLTRQLHRLAPVMLHGEELEASVLDAPDHVAARLLKHDGDRYLIMANENTRSATVQFQSDGLKPGSVKPLFDDPPVTVNESGVPQTNLKGHGARAYVITR